MAFLLKGRDGRDIAKKRYCPVQNGTYGQRNTGFFKYRGTIDHGVLGKTALCTLVTRKIALRDKRCLWTPIA
jgi:hypothetical protein